MIGNPKSETRNPKQIQMNKKINPKQINRSAFVVPALTGCRKPPEGGTTNPGAIEVWDI
jgi:hypothetical protein